MKDETTSETIRDLHESGHQDSSYMRSDSRERSENVSTTFNWLTTDSQSYEDREITFREVLLTYKEMLEEMGNQIIPNKIRTKDKRLKKGEADKLRQQFNKLKLSLPDKWETPEWRSIEQLHDKLTNLGYTEAEGQQLVKLLTQVNDTTGDLVKKLNDLGSYSYTLSLLYIWVCLYSCSIQIMATVIEKSQLYIY